MRDRFRASSLGMLIVVAALFISPSSRAQDDTGEAKGKDSGNYHIEQSIEFGYRANYLNGDMNTYNTFVNLGQGFRLFDYTLEMRSLNHQGIFFDNLSFSNFGYGGDPNDVSRLHIDKNKWYDFSALFRRDKNFWDWNLLANPLNPASSSPAVPITNSPHALDLSRRMQDYNLLLFPQSRLRFRLGYSRVRNEGPGFFTTDGGTIGDFNQAFSYTTNSYHAGVDYRVLPRTTISFDQYLTYYKQDNVIADLPQNFGYQLSNPTNPVGAAPNGAPVDLGIVWSSNTAAERLPCGPPVANFTTTPPTVNPTCNAYLSYSNVSRWRNFMPMERLGFQSNYFKKFETSGSVGYSTGDNLATGLNELVRGWTSRTASPGSTAAGPAEAKRYSVNADWSGVYAVTDKLRILDQFRYDNWRIPGMWAFDQTNLTNTAVAGLTGMQLPIAVFNTTNCPLNSNANTCPQHNSGSSADVATGQDIRFLKQFFLSDTVELQYDFTRRLSGHIGYEYTYRSVYDQNTTIYAAETYFPGGPGGSLANDLFYAARGDCAPVSTAPVVLPAGCTENADGSVTFSGPAAGTDTAPGLMAKIHGKSALLGITARPIDSLRINADFAFGYNDSTFVRTDPRNLQSYKIHATYKPKPWANIDGAIDIHENRDNTTGLLPCTTPGPNCPSPIDNLEHDRAYSFGVVLSPNPRLSVDFGYNYLDVFSQIDVCYTEGFGPPPAGTTPCPSGDASPVPLGALSVYKSTDHFAYGNLMWKPTKRVMATVGFAGSFVRGTSPYFDQPQFATATPAPALQQVTLNALTPTGTLDYNYLKPNATIAVNLYKGVTYRMSWDYYGFNGKGPADAAGLAPLGLRDFNGSTATFAFRYSF